MPEYNLKPGKLGQAAIDTYQKIEDTVVGAYQKIEDTVVGEYKRVETGFVNAFLTEKKPGEAKAPVAQAQAPDGVKVGQIDRIQSVREVMEEIVG